MPEYKVPLRDVSFVLEDVLGADAHYASLSGCEQFGADLRDAIITEAAKFAENILAPLNREGDEIGCKWEAGEVTTPPGFKEAYQQYVEGGWAGLSCPVEYGGQSLPYSAGLLLSEFVGCANWSWGMYPGLSHGAIRCLETHGTEEQKELYLHKLVEGTFSGTMCLTEPHAGSDVGLAKTKAEPEADGSYRISGTKIFISAGEHDMSDNIIHLVLARVAGAPQGSKGISLFIVPKFMVNPDGSLGERNAVSCGSIEKKMGIKASSTCVMNFDEATGYIVGEENTGLAKMFTMMNAARLGTALQGLAASEQAFQGALVYALERLQMRSLTGPKNPDGPADPLIVHPDVRRMLLTMKSFSEGSRAFLYWLAQIVDLSEFGPEEERDNAIQLLNFLTPIAKGFCTEAGLEAANHGIQVYGGHGFIREHGMEQILRDTRIATLYEGTTGIQALDLIGRKVLGTGGATLKLFMADVESFCKANAEHASLGAYISELAAKNKELGELTMELGATAMEDPDNIGAASVDYLMYAGYIVLAYMWVRMALVAQQKLDSGVEDDGFYLAKVQTCRFYFERIMPRTLMHVATMKAGSPGIMDIDAQHFSF